MKRWILYLAVLVAIFMLPKGQGTDVGKLHPAEILYIYMEEGATVVKTDTENLGVGRDLPNALKSMEENADAYVFLDTVAYVLVTEETKALLPELGAILRPGTKVVLATAPIEVEGVAKFLSIHNPQVRLCECMTEQQELPKLMTAGERFYLVR